MRDDVRGQPLQTLSGLVLSLTDEKALTTALQLWAISPSDHNTPHSYL